METDESINLLHLFHFYNFGKSYHLLKINKDLKIIVCFKKSFVQGKPFWDNLESFDDITLKLLTSAQILAQNLNFWNGLSVKEFFIVLALD